MGASGIIGKMLKGAADVAIPMAMEEQKARIMAKRDAVLMGHQREMAAEDRDFRKGEREAGQEFTAGQNTEQRDFTAEQNREQREFIQGENEAGRALESERIGIAREQLEATRDGQKILNEINTLKLENAEDQQKALAILNDPSASQESKTAAVEYLNAATGKSGVKIMQVKDSDGYYTDEFAIFDSRSGRRLNAPVVDNDPLGLLK